MDGGKYPTTQRVLINQKRDSLDSFEENPHHRSVYEYAAWGFSNAVHFHFSFVTIRCSFCSHQNDKHFGHRAGILGFMFLSFLFYSLLGSNRFGSRQPFQNGLGMNAIWHLSRSHKDRSAHLDTDGSRVRSIDSKPQPSISENLRLRLWCDTSCDKS